MIKLGFVIPESGHASRGIGAYTKNLIDEFKKDKEIIIEEINSFAEASEEMDLLHAPFFDLFNKSLPSKKTKPTIITIHDVIPLIFKKHYPPGIKGSINLFFQKRALKSVSAVITDSEASKNDIEKYLSIPKDKIHVTYLAQSDDFRVIKEKSKLDVVRKKYKLPEKFVLFTGSTNWNKNISSIALASIDAGIDAVFIGKSFENRKNLDHPELQPFKHFLEKYELNPQVHLLGFVPTDDLVPIINLAQVVLLPSHYEGFGLPILEAQACGVPVIAGKNSSMLEVARDTAYLVNSENVQEISGAIKKVCNDNETRQMLIKKGFENIKRFSWEKCAKETLEIYRKAIETK